MGVIHTYSLWTQFLQIFWCPLSARNATDVKLSTLLFYHWFASQWSYSFKLVCLFVLVHNVVITISKKDALEWAALKWYWIKGEPMKSQDNLIWSLTQLISSQINLWLFAQLVFVRPSLSLLVPVLPHAP